MRLLEGRAALVTGAANGIGRAIVERFAAEGARVAGVDVEPLPALGDAVIGFEFDLRRTEELGAVVAHVEETLGPLDVLVNNAGIFEVTPAVDLALDAYRRVLAVDLDAPVFLAASAGRAMSERGYGRIVNVTSIHARFSEERSLAYDVAKAGVEAATRTLAIEYGRRGVLVNAVAPGFVATRMSVVDGRNELDSEWFQTVYVEHRKLPLGRAAAADEVAAHVAWLSSERNTYVTGQTLGVDGGLTVTF